MESSVFFTIQNHFNLDELKSVLENDFEDLEIFLKIFFIFL